MINGPMITLLLALAAGAGGFWFGSDYKEKSMIAMVEKERDDFMKGAVMVGEELAKVKVVQKNTTQILEREIRKEIQYQECKHTPEALKVINDALKGGAK